MEQFADPTTDFYLVEKECDKMEPEYCQRSVKFNNIMLSFSNCLYEKYDIEKYKEDLDKKIALAVFKDKNDADRIIKDGYIALSEGMCEAMRPEIIEISMVQQQSLLFNNNLHSYMGQGDATSYKFFDSKSVINKKNFDDDIDIIDEEDESSSIKSESSNINIQKVHRDANLFIKPINVNFKDHQNDTDLNLLLNNITISGNIQNDIDNSAYIHFLTDSQLANQEYKPYKSLDRLKGSIIGDVNSNHEVMVDNSTEIDCGDNYDIDMEEKTLYIIGTNNINLKTVLLFIKNPKVGGPIEKHKLLRNKVSVTFFNKKDADRLFLLRKINCGKKQYLIGRRILYILGVDDNMMDFILVVIENTETGGEVVASRLLKEAKILKVIFRRIEDAEKLLSSRCLQIDENCICEITDILSDEKCVNFIQNDMINNQPQIAYKDYTERTQNFTSNDRMISDNPIENLQIGSVSGSSNIIYVHDIPSWKILENILPIIEAIGCSKIEDIQFYEAKKTAKIVFNNSEAVEKLLGMNALEISEDCIYNFSLDLNDKNLNSFEMVDNPNRTVFIVNFTSEKYFNLIKHLIEKKAGKIESYEYDENSSSVKVIFTTVDDSKKLLNISKLEVGTIYFVLKSFEDVLMFNGKKNYLSKNDSLVTADDDDKNDNKNVILEINTVETKFSSDSSKNNDNNTLYLSNIPKDVHFELLSSILKNLIAKKNNNFILKYQQGSSFASITYENKEEARNLLEKEEIYVYNDVIKVNQDPIKFQLESIDIKENNDELIDIKPQMKIKKKKVPTATLR